MRPICEDKVCLEHTLPYLTFPRDPCSLFYIKYFRVTGYQLGSISFLH
jgi:hypothetical protein